MKKAIYTFALFFFIPCFLMAQAGNTIQYASSNPNRDPSPGNNGATVTLDYHATSGGRHSYRYIFLSSPLIYVEVIYRNSRWEIHGFETGVGDDLWYISTVQSTPNPPNLTFGNWSNEMTNFSGTGTQSALPVELIQFEATTETGKTLLTWATASETNNKGFEIEKSTDGVHFQKIGFVAGKGTGNSSREQHYSFEDAAPFTRSAQVAYYRLRQVDYDGRFEHSKIISVRNGKSNTSIQVYPTLTKDALTVAADGAPVDMVTVVNHTGQVVLTAQQVSSVDMSALPAGLYLVQAQAGQEWVTERVFKQ